uniref:Putative secreted protein n=1 Tax=Ixodes ricinus TaxID=34613 RepID=A0A147BP26_IXORI
MQFQCHSIDGTKVSVFVCVCFFFLVVRCCKNSVLSRGKCVNGPAQCGPLRRTLIFVCFRRRPNGPTGRCPRTDHLGSKGSTRLGENSLVSRSLNAKPVTFASERYGELKALSMQRY